MSPTFPFVCNVLLVRHSPSYGIDPRRWHWRRLSTARARATGLSCTICAGQARSSFDATEAGWGKVVTLTELMIRGWGASSCWPEAELIWA
jgi:hypothetical protein